MKRTVVLALAAVAVNSAYVRNTRRAIPQELFRDNVEPSKGGKVPEAAHMRIELNKLDAAGLESGEGVEMMRQLMASDITLPEKAGSQYNPGYSPPLKLKPGYAPKPAPHSLPSQSYGADPYAPAPYQPQAYKPYSPEPSYAPEPYSPPKPAYSPDPYSPPKPAYAPPAPEYHKPVGPILLEKRPYEVKSVQPLPISVAESYSNFDCRQAPYPDRHYADPETGCEVYHFCHADGKQDTFHCGYGTVFNEYLGTCDYKNNVHCGAGHPAAPYPAAAPHKVAHAPHHAPAPYHEAAYSNFGPFGYN